MAAPRLELLQSRFSRPGAVEWIGLRPGRRAPMTPVSTCEVVVPGGLVGDRYAGRRGERAVTLMQAEHMPVIAALCGLESVAPVLLRRNVVVSGVNLQALKRRRFRIGSAVLEGTGPCDPCSRMETALGEGGYNAMRGHGGITARVLEPGQFNVDDVLTPL